MRHAPGLARFTPSDLDWGVARGVVGFRWLALAWATAVLVLTRDDLSRPAAAVAWLGAALVVTAATTEASVRRRAWLFSPAAVATELALGASMLVADGVVYDTTHGQSLGSAWPIAGVLMAAVVGGAVPGTVAGLWLGAARWVGSAVAPFPPASTLSLVSSGVLFAIAGGAAGAAMGRVRAAEMEVAHARARADVARTLHDGVLQTLAVVQRRSDDVELATLARDQELELRAFLAGDRPTVDALGPALRQAAARIERRDGLRVQVLLVSEDHPPVAPEVVEAVAGAVGEALTNAHKHGRAGHATVFVDVDDDVFCSVKDDGVGFDPTSVPAGSGTSSSIHGRLAEVGGTAQVDGREGSGVEVRMRAPRSAPR